MKLRDIEQGLASGKLASELSLEDWTHKLYLIQEFTITDSTELENMLWAQEGDDEECALCIKCVKSEHTCKNCPLGIVGPYTCFCHDSYYRMFIRASNHDDLVSATKNMISALEKAVDVERGSRHE
jgi:hypothetical protein